MFMLKTIGCDSSQMVYIPQVLKINCFFLHTRDGDYQGETWQKICRKRSCLWAKPASWYRLIKTVPHGPLRTALMSQMTGYFEQRASGKKKEPSYFVIYLLVNFYSHRQNKKRKMMKLQVSTTVVAKFLFYCKMVASLPYIRFTVDSSLITWRLGPLWAHTSLPPAWFLPWNLHFNSNEKKTSLPQRPHTENPSLTQAGANWKADVKLCQ